MVLNWFQFWWESGKISLSEYNKSYKLIGQIWRIKKLIGQIW
jgi:hypothetical protein